MNLDYRPSEKSVISGESVVHGYSVKSLVVIAGGESASTNYFVTCWTVRVANRGSSSTTLLFFLDSSSEIVMMRPLLASSSECVSSRPSKSMIE